MGGYGITINVTARRLRIAANTQHGDRVDGMSCRGGARTSTTNNKSDALD